MEFNKVYSRSCIRGGIKSINHYIIYKNCKITITEYNIHIENSYIIDDKKDILDTLNFIKTNYTCKVMEKRSIKSLYKEWVAHNNLYKLGLWKEHTISVDLDYPQSIKYKIAWFLLSIIRL